jgi:nitrite reductase/ring-hydroxylating ferredoxin subunit
MKIENPDSLSRSPDGRPDAEQPLWREQFPIDWPTDDFRSRRDFTKLLGLTSLAFVAGQIWIAVLASGAGRPAPCPPVRSLPGRASGRRLEGLDYPRAGATCVLTRVAAERFVAYGQKCTHLSCPSSRSPSRAARCPLPRRGLDLATGRLSVRRAGLSR